LSFWLKVHRLPASHEQLVDDVLVRPTQRPEFGGQGEGQQKILGGHLLLHLAFQPLLALMVLTVRAVAMAAGMRHQRLMRTLRAFDLHLGAGLRAAVLHGAQGALVSGQQTRAVLGEQFGFEGVDDRGQADHLTAPH
jgi:hypothetical protein